MEMASMASMLDTKKLLGRGSFGSVFSVKYRDHDYALKCMCGKKAWIRELKVMCFLKDYETKVNANIVKLCGVTRLTMNGKEYGCLFYELLNNVTLAKFIQRKVEKCGCGLSLVDVFQFGRGILSALKHLHKLNVAHADIKPDNIGFLTDSNHRGIIKVFDLGCAVIMPCTVEDVFQTKAYRAPEVFGEKGTIRDVTLAVDMFSFGCVMAEMYTGKTLFDTEFRYCNLTEYAYHVLDIESNNRQRGKPTTAPVEKMQLLKKLLGCCVCNVSDNNNKKRATAEEVWNTFFLKRDLQQENIRCK